ncbi:MFS transporter [Ruminiclostridium josui]|uniref:MFS transporter n=1 Tax=Ruminiclostridium josui TaxID=1499 RepID=UPI0004B446F6|nr:MFS transporter [Ruminiclostridium josui]
MSSSDNINNKSEKNISVLWSRAFIFLIAVSLITATGFNMVYTVISKYSMDIQNSLAMAGVISGIFSVAALVMRPFAGMMADFFNKKYLCIGANVVIGLSVIGYFFSSSIPVLFFFRVLHGVAFGVSSTVNIALATRFIPKERLGEGIGYYGIGQVVASIIGPNLGIYVVDKYGFQTLFIVITLLSFLGAALLLCLKYPAEENKMENVRARSKLTIDALIAKEGIIYAIIGGMFSFGNGVVSSFLILLGKERNIANVGIFFSVGAVVVFLLRLFVGRIVDKTGLAIIVNISLIVSAISMVLIGVAPTLGLLIVASVLKSIGQGGGQVSLQSESIKRVSPSRVGVATSTYYIGADIGQGLGPIIGGGISQYFNYTVMFMVCSVLLLVSMVVFNVYQRKIRYSVDGEVQQTAE